MEEKKHRRLRRKTKRSRMSPPAWADLAFHLPWEGGGVKIDKGIFHCLRGSGGCPR